MTVLQVVVSDRAMRALEDFGRATGRTVEDLAEAAIEDAAIRSALDETAKSPTHSASRPQPGTP